MTTTIDLTLGEIIPTMYLINLDDAEDRRNHFLSQIAKMGSQFNVIRVSAVNGLTYQFSEKELNMFENYKTQWFYNRENMRKKIMGNQLSHYYVLNDVIKNNRPYALVFQDDVVFKEDFLAHITRALKCVPSDAEIINLGYHKEADGPHFVPLDLKDPIVAYAHVKERITDGVCTLGPNINPCSLAYIITLKGAKNLVEYFDTNGFEKETDHNFNLYLIAKNIFYASIPILCTGNHHFPSSIFL
jgi:GR25 family glycosyltransferase involved in LPS biosynthesis